MNENDISKFKKMLDAEKALLENELASVGRINPANPGDWEAKATDLNDTTADENDVADSIEEYEDNAAILKQLETRYNEVKVALDKIEKGIYGICRISGEKIELDRLEANPAATTCKEHMDM